MRNYVLSFYLEAMSKVEHFIREERGDQMTSTFGLMVIVVVVATLLLGGLRAFFPVLWGQITTNITNLWSP